MKGSLYLSLLERSFLVLILEGEDFSGALDEATRQEISS
jgi:hypothetical protein